ncbi:MAG: hypothetical protein M0Z68_06840 [Gammaproteobacteria bacterium]|nr:hypothetical protein [Gammaproteobacteria bacterium]
MSDLEDQIEANAIKGVETFAASTVGETLGDIGAQSKKPVIAASFLRDLVTRQRDNSKHPLLVCIHGVRIDEDLNLGSVKITCPLILVDCDLGPLFLTNANAGLLGFLSCCLLGEVVADGLSCTSSLLLTRTHTGAVSLSNANIEGSLGLEQAVLRETNGYSLTADGIQVGRCIFLRGAQAARVRLLGARIGANFECQGAQLSLTRGGSQPHAPDHVVLGLDGARIEGNVILSEGFGASGPVFKGAVFMRDVRIDGSFSCVGARFLGAPNGYALEIDRSEVRHNLEWHNVSIEGGVSANGLRVGGSWQCAGASLAGEPASLYALLGDGLQVGGALLLHNGFTASGGVRLFGARIAQSMDCSGGHFQASLRAGSAEKQALVLDGARIGGGLFFRDRSCVEGEIRLPGAHIEGPLRWKNATLRNANETAVMAESARLDGAVSFEACLVEGAVRMDSTLMGQGLCIQKSALCHASGSGLDLSYAQIEQQLSIKETTVGGRLVLTHASAARWEWNPSKDPEVRADLLGFTYDTLVQDTPAVRPNDWLSWMKRNAQSSPQPYRQLERAFRADGHEQDARVIYIEGRRALRTQLTTRRGKLWDWTLDRLLGYGYKSGRALWALVVVFALGCLVSAGGYRAHVIAPIRALAYARAVAGRPLPAAYPRFHPFLYSLHNTLPFIFEGQSHYWRPRETFSVSATSFWLLEGWMVFQIVLSQLLWILAAAGFTGLVRKGD